MVPGALLLKKSTGTGRYKAKLKLRLHFTPVSISDLKIEDTQSEEREKDGGREDGYNQSTIYLCTEVSK
jgi:hypothetical protein